MSAPSKLPVIMPDKARIEEFLRWAEAPPDADLLRRYFNECAGLSIEQEDKLQRGERLWVKENLMGNPSWQESWKGLEEGLGKRVNQGDLPSLPLLDQVPAPPVKSATSNFLASLFASLRGISVSPPFSPLRLVPASIVLLALYGSLWLAGLAVQPQSHSLAAVADYKEELTDRRRNVTEVSDFTLGATALLSASESTFGLFPRYDEAIVDTAIVHLKRVFEESTSNLRAKAAFFLAKAYLMQDDIPQARAMLQEVLNQNVTDFRTDAEDLMQKLEKL